MDVALSLINSSLLLFNRTIVSLKDLYMQVYREVLQRFLRVVDGTLVGLAAVFGAQRHDTGDGVEIRADAGLDAEQRDEVASVRVAPFLDLAALTAHNVSINVSVGLIVTVRGGVVPDDERREEDLLSAAPRENEVRWRGGKGQGAKQVGTHFVRAELCAKTAWGGYTRSVDAARATGSAGFGAIWVEGCDRKLSGEAHHGYKVAVHLREDVDAGGDVELEDVGPAVDVNG
ncbi:hypothetical protein B0H11DRAFT_1929807 [Mycena galericulata]|nr:hypothetical protein B0H11DRAFT_1929807 [Mycena galericulata]